MPVSGTLENLRVGEFTIRKNGVSVAAMSCKVEGTNKTCHSSDTVSFNAGETISLQASPTSKPNSRGSLRWSATLTS